MVDYTKFIGIDPGLTGCIASITISGSVKSTNLIDLPTIPGSDKLYTFSKKIKRILKAGEYSDNGDYMYNHPKVFTKKTGSDSGGSKDPSLSEDKKMGGMTPFTRGGCGGLGTTHRTTSQKLNFLKIKKILQKEILGFEGKTLIVIENQYARPVQGISSSFSLGFTFGGLLALLSGFDEPYLIEDPNSWKRSLGLLGQDKGASIDLALKFYPDADIRLKKHHNRAEALLLANVGYRLFNNEKIKR